MATLRVNLIRYFAKLCQRLGAETSTPKPEGIGSDSDFDRRSLQPFVPAAGGVADALHTDSITGTSTSTPTTTGEGRAGAGAEERDRHRHGEFEEVAGADQRPGDATLCGTFNHRMSR
jgi:hypothetical protein